VSHFSKTWSQVYLGVGSLDSWTNGLVAHFIEESLVLPMVVLLSNKGSVFKKDIKSS